jgi:putative tricarboxylic transport membrane protein
MPILDRLLRVAPFLAVGGVALWLWSQADTFAIATQRGRVGPELWPRIVLTLLLGAALWGAVAAFLRAQSEGGTDTLASYTSNNSGGGAGPHEQVPRAKPRPVLALAGLAAMLAYVAALPYLGYAVCTFLLLLAIMLLAGYRRPLSALLIAFLGTLAFFFVFQRIAYVSLPLGSGVFRQFSIALMALIGVR